MSIFRWLSNWFAKLSRRERLVVAGGAAVSLLAILLVLVILPLSRRWSEREVEIEAKAAQVARLEALVSGQGQLEAAINELMATRDDMARRLLGGSTPALAASTLQTLLRSYAERSRVSLQRVDADRQFEPGADGLTPIGIELYLSGDVYGLVDFLFYLENGEKLLVIEDLRIDSAQQRRANPETELLTWTIRLHGLYVAEEEPA